MILKLNASKSQNLQNISKQNITKAKETVSFYSTVLDVYNILIRADKNYDKHSHMDLAYTIVTESEKNNLDPYLILALIKTESSYRPTVVSYKGAVGLMQLLPTTAQYISDKSNLALQNTNEIFDPVLNIKLGIHYFAYLKNKFKGNEEYAIAAYNMGPSNIYRYVRKNGKLPKYYTKKVNRSYKRIIALSGRV